MMLNHFWVNYAFKIQYNNSVYYILTVTESSLCASIELFQHSGLDEFACENSVGLSVRTGFSPSE